MAGQFTICRALSNLSFVLGVMLQLGSTRIAEAGSITVNGVTFSDDLGGFVLESASGQGSMDDPFVLTERITSPEGGTLTLVVPMAFGNQIGSPHAVGFALIKVIKNATSEPWTGFELELQSKLGVPSDDTDGLSFGQGSVAGRPFTAIPFHKVTIQDSPYDRVEIDQGRVPIGGSMKLSLVITLFDPLPEAYLVQRPSKPVALRPLHLPNNQLAAR
jgi:hypothetical protein